MLTAAIAVAIAGIPVHLFSESFLPEPLVAYLDGQVSAGLTAADGIASVFAVVFLALSVFNVLQMYQFKRSSRPIAIALTSVGLFAELFFGPVVEASLAQFVSELATLLWGAVLAMMYCPPYDSLFANSQLPDRVAE
jgi:hypothetical protein